MIPRKRSSGQESSLNRNLSKSCTPGTTSINYTLKIIHARTAGAESAARTCYKNMLRGAAPYMHALLLRPEYSLGGPELRWQVSSSLLRVRHQVLAPRAPVRLDARRRVRNVRHGEGFHRSRSARDATSKGHLQARVAEEHIALLGIAGHARSH